MGGTVSSVIRKENGEVIKMARKTGSYNYMFSSKEFNNNEIEKAIDNHTQIFFDMKKDLKKGTPYEFPMSPVYGGADELAPSGYGLVVIDFQYKKIHSLQGYGTPGLFYAGQFGKHIIYDKKTTEDYDFLFRENKLLMYQGGELSGSVHEVFGTDITLEKMGAIIQDTYNPIKKIMDKLNIKKISFHVHDMEFKPKILEDFELKIYDESIEGLIEFAQNLVSDGFTFTEAEKEMWLSFSEDYLDDLELEEDNDEWTDEEYDEKVKELGAVYTEKLKNILDSNLKTKNKP